MQSNAVTTVLDAPLLVVENITSTLGARHTSPPKACGKRPLVLDIGTTRQLSVQFADLSCTGLKSPLSLHDESVELRVLRGTFPDEPSAS